jgi:hypothetical protein
VRLVQAIDRRRGIADAEDMIDQDQLRAAFEAAAVQMPDGFELAGVTFHGPSGHREWVAFAQRDGEPSAGCEGWGNTPFEALTDLMRHVRAEH